MQVVSLFSDWGWNTRCPRSMECGSELRTTCAVSFIGTITLSPFFVSR